MSNQLSILPVGWGGGGGVNSLSTGIEDLDKWQEDNLHGIFKL